MAETSSSMVVTHNKLLKLPDKSELVMTPSIYIEAHLVFPERSEDETNNEFAN